MKPTKTALNAIAAVLTVLYPFVVFLGLQYFQPRVLVIYLFVVVSLRLLAGNGVASLFNRQFTWLIGVACLLIVVMALFYNSIEALKLYPVLVSFSLLTVFLISLYYPPTIVERLARIRDPELPPGGVTYTRNVTGLWCGFFLVNGLIALATSLAASVDVWMIYNGFVSYCLMGVLFGGELLYRYVVAKRRPG